MGHDLDDNGTSREMLEQELARLRGNLAALEREESGLVDSQQGREVRVDGAGGDGDSLSVERGAIRTMTTQLESRVAELEEALGQLDDGSYGLCEVCGEPIDPERLEALPGCRECMDCKRSGRA